MNQQKRKNMKPEERRSQLIDVAQYLFFTKGFEDTTMADIMAAANISKGGFYHHFTSKDELLFAVLGRIADLVLAPMDAIANDTSSPALNRLDQYLKMRSSYLKEHDYAGQVEFFRVMNDDKNILLLEMFKRHVRDALEPTLTKIIQDGCDEGTFDVADAKTAADMVIVLGTFFDPALKYAIDVRGTERADAAAANLSAAMDMQFLAIDRVLGLPDGTTDFGFPGVVELTMSIPPKENQRQDDA